MKAFVTGATGFIGQNLVERLLSQNFKVIILSRDIKTARKIFGKRVATIKGDLLDPNSLKKAASCDLVFNLAGSLPHHKAEEKVYWNVNFRGVKNLLDVVKNRKIKRFVHVSTVGIYGSQKRIINENSKTNLKTPYERSKYKGEQLVFDYYKKYKLPVTIIKPTIAFGPKDTRPGFIDLFRLISKNKFIITGSGKNHLHTIYIDNLVDALIKASKVKLAIGKDFIIGDNPCPTIENIVHGIEKVEGKRILPFNIPLRIARALGVVGDILIRFKINFPLNSARVKFITEERKYSIKKAQKILKWEPKVKLLEGLEKTYFWYRENKYLK